MSCREKLLRDAVIVADGGDFLSFARIGLPATTYIDPGSLGCIGVGTPFGIAAILALPGRTVVVATGDGAFGLNAMEIDTAARHKALVLIVVTNNGSWAIEVRDQQETHGKVVGTACSSPTTPRWRAPSACMPSALSAPRTSRQRSTARSRRWRRGGHLARCAGDTRSIVFGREVRTGLGAQPARLAGTRPSAGGGKVDDGPHHFRAAAPVSRPCG